MIGVEADADETTPALMSVGRRAPYLDTFLFRSGGAIREANTCLN